MTEPWLRLSVDLLMAVHPWICQACGGHENLERWQEHDADDRPEPIIVVLCRPCADRIIEPHPRLYRHLGRHDPVPGCMDLCVDCRHRSGTRCTHPDAKANGGSGVILTVAPPSQMHVCRRGKGQRSGWETIWEKSPSACKQKEHLNEHHEHDL